MARRASRRATPVRNLLYPLYLVSSKGGPGVQIHLRNGRWRVAHLNPRLTTTILAAATCSRSKGQCSGRCSSGKSCQMVAKVEIVEVEVPVGVPVPTSGKPGVIKRIREECLCLPSFIRTRRRVGR
jgi:hypothetical protein